MFTRDLSFLFVVVEAIYHGDELSIGELRLPTQGALVPPWPFGVLPADLVLPQVMVRIDQGTI